jgi:hypothetical protein
MRQPVLIKPTTARTFFVQAYYQDEVKENGEKIWQLIPADQTYITTAKKNYQLYLKKGKYMIVFRDIEYQILGTLNIEVN